MKKTIYAILVLCLLLMFGACNKNPEENSGKKNCKHAYTEEITAEASCTQDGTMTLTCKDCGHSYTEKISAKGHNYSSKIITAATCTSSGIKQYTCSDCGKTYGETVSAMGHNWVNATCTKAKYCSTCNTIIGQALGHTTQNGTCNRCGKTFSVLDQCSLVTNQNLPVSVSRGSDLYDRVDATAQINSASYSFYANNDGTVNLQVKVSFSITYLYKPSWDMFSCNLLLYNEEGNIVGSMTAMCGNAVVGLSTSDTVYFYDLEPGKYTVEFCDDYY